MKLRRRFSFAFCFALLLLGSGCGLDKSVSPGDAAQTPVRETRFKILQVNDTYKIEGLEGGNVGGFARLRTIREQLEAGGEKVLLLHAGDFLFPSVTSKYLKGDSMIRVLNLMDGAEASFDDRLIAVFGNHEFDDSDPAIVLGRVAQSDFDWISSNTRYRSDEKSAGEPFFKRLTNIHELIVKDVGGVKVGIFGLTLDVQNPPYVAFDYGTLDRRWAVVKNALSEFNRLGAQVVIALSHQDFEQDQIMAREFPEIDLIVGGHEHFFIEKQIGNTWITKADADNKTAVLHEVEVHADGSVTTSHKKLELDSSVEKDSKVQAEIDAQLDKLANVLAKSGKQLREVLGATKYLLEGVEPAVRGRETALGNFLADVLRERMKTDLAFTNGGGIRLNDNIPPGPVTTYDMEGIFYYDNNLVSFELNGAQILDVLRNAVSKSHLGDGRFLQVSGIRFKYHASQKNDEWVYTIEAEDVEVQPFASKTFVALDEKKTYRVASTDFIWNYGYRDGYAIFSQGDGKTSPARIDQGPALSFRKATEEAIAGLPDKTITNQVEGRIVRLEE